MKKEVTHNTSATTNDWPQSPARACSNHNGRQTSKVSQELRCARPKNRKGTEMKAKVEVIQPLSVMTPKLGKCFQFAIRSKEHYQTYMSRGAKSQKWLTHCSTGKVASYYENQLSFCVAFWLLFFLFFFLIQCTLNDILCSTIWLNPFSRCFYPKCLQYEEHIWGSIWVAVFCWNALHAGCGVADWSGYLHLQMDNHSYLLGFICCVYNKVESEWYYRGQTKSKLYCLMFCLEMSGTHAELTSWDWCNLILQYLFPVLYPAHLWKGTSLFFFFYLTRF